MLSSHRYVSFGTMNIQIGHLVEKLGKSADIFRHTGGKMYFCVNIHKYMTEEDIPTV